MENMSNRLHREMEAALMEQMLPFAEDLFGDEAINEALLLFLDDDEAGEFDLEDPLNTIFIPWFLFTWRIESEEEKPVPHAPMMKTVAEAYLEARRSELTPDMIALLEAGIRRPFSFYQVLESVAGKSLRLEDLLLGKIVDVAEDAASTSLRKGEIVMASLLRPLAGIVRPLTLSPFALEKGERPIVEELKDEISANSGTSELSEDILLQQEAFVIGLYLDIVDEMLDEESLDDPHPPKRR
jgi:hypothetical protein